MTIFNIIDVLNTWSQFTSVWNKDLYGKLLSEQQKTKHTDAKELLRKNICRITFALLDEPLTV